jgi:hypothetical protein
MSIIAVAEREKGPTPVARLMPRMILFAASEMRWFPVYPCASISLSVNGLSKLT